MRGLLLKMVQNKLADKVRRGDNHMAVLPAEYDAAAGGPAPDGAVADRELVAAVLAGLSDEERKLLEARFVDDRSWAGVAALADGGERSARRGNAVRMRLERAVTRAKRGIGPVEDRP